MNTAVDHPTLLEAVGEFLMGELAPTLEGNKALQFRVLIAANLTSVIASELRTGPAFASATRERLRMLYPDRPTDSAAELQQRLMRELRDGALSDARMKQLIDTLKADAAEALAVANPRFTLD